MKHTLFAFCVCLMALSLTGQELKKIGQFTSLDKEVQVLPGLASVTDGQDRDTHAKKGSLCRELKQIHRIPFNDEPVNDVTYNKVAQAGSTIVPCLLSRIIDTTKMHDPRSEPTFSDFRVGDLAFFLLIQLQKVPFETMLPSEVQARLKTEGVYAYFRYVSHFKNRQTLQRRVREWLKYNTAAGSTTYPLAVEMRGEQDHGNEN